jgi:hypothetical protein
MPRINDGLSPKGKPRPLEPDFEQILMKARSDYVLTPLTSHGIATMMVNLAPLAAGAIVLLCDSYGGRIAGIAAGATAFPRRAGTRYCIQYFSSWSREPSGAGRKGLRGDAAAYARCILRQLLRSRSAGLRHRVLGQQSCPPGCGEAAIRSRRHFPPRPERASERSHLLKNSGA